MRGGWLIMFVQFCGLMIPAVGVLALLKKEQTKTSMYLLLTNISCLVINAGYFLLMGSGSMQEAYMAYKVEYLGNAFFYLFFVLFLLSYFGRRIHAIPMTIWLVSEMIQVFILWRGNINFESMEAMDGIVFSPGILMAQMNGGTLYYIRHAGIAYILLHLLIFTLYRMIKVKSQAERNNLGRLAGSEFIVLMTLIIMQIFAIPFDIVPISASLSVCAIILSVIRGEFNVTDVGKEWLFEDMKDFFVVVDADYGYLDANLSARRVFFELNVYTKGQKVSKRLYELFTSEEECPVINGRHYNKKVVPIEQEDVICGYSMLLSDCNEMYLLMEELRDAKEKAEDANKAKSAFVSMISHEIRTPMNVIVGMTELMLRSEQNEKQKKYLHNIRTSGETLLSIINDILDFSKMESGRMELVEDTYCPQEMLEDLKLFFQNRIGEKPIAMVYDIDERLPRCLYGDNLRLRQVLINIVNNAIKYTEEGSVTLKIDVTKEEKDSVTLMFYIIDTGMGIREEDLAHLFEAFQQMDKEKNRYKEGTGLGLTISSQLVELMGGAIRVESVYGKGSTFSFEVVQRSGDISVLEQKKTADYREFTAPDAKILIVDDNTMNLEVETEMLQPLGMQVDTAVNGMEALRRMESQKYHLIFMDHMMPVMDGVETVKRLRSLDGEWNRQVPVIALTANATKEAKEAFLQAGMNDFLPKPINFRELYGKLYQWLPQELRIEAEDGKNEKEDTEQKTTEEAGKLLPEIEGIDTVMGVENCGSPELLCKMFGTFYRLIDVKSKKIEETLEEGLIKDYTVEVHSLKSSARLIGAMELSQLCQRLEQLGKEENRELLEKETPEAMKLYRRYKESLRVYADSGVERRQAETEELLTLLDRIRQGIDSFQLDAADEALKELESCLLPEALFEKMEQLRVCVADVAMEEILRLTDEMSEYLRQNGERK